MKRYRPFHYINEGTETINGVQTERVTFYSDEYIYEEVRPMLGADWPHIIVARALENPRQPYSLEDTREELIGELNATVYVIGTWSRLLSNISKDMVNDCYNQATQIKVIQIEICDD